MNIKRIPIHYVLAHSGEMFRNDTIIYNKIVPDNYPWVTKEKPKPFRRVLMTVIDYTRSTRNKALNELYHFRNENETEYVIFDSGGFQMLRRPEFTIDRLIKENLHIYKEHNWADNYILPDNPPNPKDSFDKQRTAIDNTIKATLTTFEKLPCDIQAKSVPVFHIQNKIDIDHQYPIYKDIIDLSKTVCYAIPGARKKLDIHNIQMINYLRNILPNDVKIHALGIATPPSVWAMYKLGIFTYDSISPRIAGANGLIIFPTGSYNCTVKRKDFITPSKLHDLKETNSHKCPFCDDYNKLLRFFRYRILHNLIVYDELNWYFRNMNSKTFLKMFPKTYQTLNNAFFYEGKKIECIL